MKPIDRMRHVARFWEFVPFLAGSMTLLIGSCALTGWTLGMPGLTQWALGFDPIRFDAALAIALCGIGLLALEAKKDSVVWFCGAVAAAIGLYNLVAYAGLGGWISAPMLPAVSRAWIQNLPMDGVAPDTALAFVFAGGTLVSAGGVVNRRHQSSMIFILGCAVIAVALLGRLEWIGGNIADSALPDQVRMTTSTALGLAVLGTGLLGVAGKLHKKDRPEPSAAAAGSVKHGGSKQILRIMVLQGVATGVLVASLGILAIGQVRLQRSDAMARHAIGRTGELQRAEIALEYDRIDAVTANFTGNQVQSASREVAAALAACRLVTGDPTGIGEHNRDVDPSTALLRDLCSATLNAAPAGLNAARFQTTTGLHNLRALEDGLRNRINQLIVASLDEATIRRAGHASTMLWQAAVLITCLIAGIGVSAFQFGMLSQLNYQHSALASEMVRRQEAEAQSRAYLEVAPTAILAINGRGQITFANSRTLSDFGYESTGLLGQPLEILVPDRHRGAYGLAFSAYVQAPVAGRVGKDLDLFARRKDGKEFPVEVQVSPVDGPSGKLVLAAVTDISQHKKSEAELRRALKELEAFSHSVSHDLRRPLQIMSGFSELLEAQYAESLSSDGQDCVRKIRAAGAHMGSLIEDLLRLARVSTTHIQRERVSLSELAQAACEDLQLTEPKPGVDLKIGQSLEVDGDPNFLRILLVNLLGNAWKFTGKTARPKIELGVTQINSVPVYFVKDNGVGFDMNKSESLFKAFHRLHDAADFPGTGIGLATVQRIVHRHGGQIWAVSQPNCGATFFFTLEAVSSPQLDTVAA